MTKVEGKSQSEVREMMSRGEIVTNMWLDMQVYWQEAELVHQMSNLQLELDGATAQLSSIALQITALQKMKKEQEQRVSEIKRRMANKKISPKAITIAETLAKAEESLEKQLKKQLKESQLQEDTVLALEDIGYFLNSLGMARNAGKLFVLCQDDVDMTEMSIVDAGVMLMDHVSLSDRLDIQFSIHMVKHKHYPPYQEHWKECAVCGIPLAELLTEYEITS